MGGLSCLFVPVFYKFRVTRARNRMKNSKLFSSPKFSHSNHKWFVIKAIVTRFPYIFHTSLNLNRPRLLFGFTRMFWIDESLSTMKTTWQRPFNVVLRNISGADNNSSNESVTRHTCDTTQRDCIGSEFLSVIPLAQAQDGSLKIKKM